MALGNHGPELGWNHSGPTQSGPKARCRFGILLERGDRTNKAGRCVCITWHQRNAATLQYQWRNRQFLAATFISSARAEARSAATGNPANHRHSEKYSGDSARFAAANFAIGGADSYGCA